MTLLPTTGPDSGTFNWCLLCGEYGLADAIANVLLFVPVAVALRCTGVSGRWTVALLCLLSIAIELTQLRIPGRESALGDVVANTSGAAVGVALVWWFSARRRSGTLAFAAACAVLGVVVCIGLVMRPSLPPTVYYGQWTADLGMYDWYRGRVLSAEIGGLPLPSWRLDDSRAVRERLLSGVPLEVRAVAGPRTGRMAPVFSIFDDARHEMLVLGADRNDLVLHVRRRATDLKLREPDVRWRGAMAWAAPGDSLALELRASRSGFCLRLNGRERCGVALTAGEAWGLVQDRPDLSADAHRALDCLFMILLGLPLGLLCPRRASGYAAIATMAVGVVLLPLLLGLARTPLIQVAGLALGIVAGGLVPDRGQHSNAPLDAVVA